MSEEYIGMASKDDGTTLEIIAVICLVNHDHVEHEIFEVTPGGQHA